MSIFLGGNMSHYWKVIEEDIVEPTTSAYTTKKYVDEKIAISEHNYHILRGDYHELNRDYAITKKEFAFNYMHLKSIQESYGEILNTFIKEEYTNTVKNIKIFMLLTIIAYILLFILWVVLWLRF